MMTQDLLFALNASPVQILVGQLALKSDRPSPPSPKKCLCEQFSNEVLNPTANRNCEEIIILRTEIEIVAHRNSGAIATKTEIAAHK
jgi:hypothetical protein